MDYDLDNLFLCEEYKLQSVSISGITQNFYELPSACTDYDLTGQVLWPGARALSEYFINNPDRISNTEVLEVGAGSGFVGLVISDIASRVILTDGNEVVLKLLEKNREFARGPVDIVKLEWGEEDPVQLLEAIGVPGKYRTIIGADVVYWSNSIVPLFDCIGKILEKNGEFLMCYTLRAKNTHRDLLNVSAEMGFSNSLLFQNEDIYIYSFRVN